MISLLPLNMLNPVRLDRLVPELGRIFGDEIHLIEDGLPCDCDAVFDTRRQQYNSTEILARLLEMPHPPGKIVGVTDMDLFIPILTFVFGEALLNGDAAVVSYHRLRNEFYGLPADNDLLEERLLKEIVHELGHTYGLIHCPRYDCVMHSSTYVEEIDIKSAFFCPDCLAQLQSVL